MLSEIKGIGPQTEKKLNSLKIFSKADLIKHIPKAYMDMSILSSPFETEEGQFCFFEAKITRIYRPFKKGKLEIIKAECEYENRKILLAWFNKNYISKILKIENYYHIYGKLKIEKNNLIFYNALFEEKSENSSYFGIHPIYLTRGVIPQKTYTKFVKNAFDISKVKSIIDSETENKFGLMSLEKAYQNIHFPINLDLKKEKERIGIENIVRRICAFKIARKNQISAKIRQYIHKVDYNLLYDKLPFKLNVSQLKAIEKIENVFYSKEKVNAILCGDVGSGKTIVAVATVFFVVKNGYRAAIMAPTEVLAKQHYNFMKPLFEKLNINVGFLSGSIKSSEKNSIHKLAKQGYFDIMIGTHSLLNLALEMPNLSFVVMDEQHRFGVAQRTQLIDKGKSVDVLTLSATPIPRSLQLVAYGEVEYITIEKRFKSTVKTAIVSQNKRINMWQYLAKECDKGNLAYVVVPKIYDVEGISSSSLESVQTELENYLNKNHIGILHGKMKSDEKETVLEKFASGSIKVLLSTTVIEVGIDVPQASIMIILNAERFGLATLHQLRGRVGRNGQPAYCFLYTENQVSEGLQVLCECDNGFEIAERDFNMRGGGDIFGLEQSGESSLSGLNIKTLKVAQKITAEVDIESIKGELEAEISGFSLLDVTLN